VKIARLRNTAAVVQVRHMEINGMKFVPPSDFDSLIKDLCDVDGFSGACVVYDLRVKEIFLKARLIKENARGGCYGTPKLKKFQTKLEEAFYKEMPDAKLVDRRKSRA
jgi:hypothetical protein